MPPADIPFAAFLAEIVAQPPLRQAITDAYRLAETVCMPQLIAAATLPDDIRLRARNTARLLVTRLRAKPKPAGIEAMMREYALSSEEGVALMCLAEALLRIPDTPTRDALIRDKISGRGWHVQEPSRSSHFVYAAVWALQVTGRLTGADEDTLAGALTRLLARGGAPLIRRAMDLAMRMMGEQFVMGKTIETALGRARKCEAQGFRYSYDMLGEAAVTAADANRYLAAYEHAIHAIGAASQNRGIYHGPGISIKLSALHPRYLRAQRGRILTELLPRLIKLARLARAQNIGLSIDAEESDRLDLSLDLLEVLCFDPGLADWHGIGFVVQAYQKRSDAVLDYCIDLAKRSKHRLMIRLVKGAYWDTEIKRAQVDGHENFPVFTRKYHTDVSYIVGARKLMAAGAAVYPQFATHNALTLATIHAMGSGDDYEFQCLHGMGEDLYREVVGHQNLNIACRIYAPVGGHETLLAYLVRRLLENGANSSFVNRIHDPGITVDELLADPVAQARMLSPIGAPHEKICAPPDLFKPARKNSKGFDLANETSLRNLAVELTQTSFAATIIAPADATTIERAFTQAQDHVTLPRAKRSEILSGAADALEQNRARLLNILVQEAGKTIPNALAEIREAVDFLRYYAAQIEAWADGTHQPLGIVVCISPWNFPLAIFLGQIAAAFAAGNAVLAKPAAETPCVAIHAVDILRKAGIPSDALHLIQGGAKTGAALVADARTEAVVFTGSTQAAKSIHRQLACRASPAGGTIPLIAETGGQNAMIVDSSALAEQVVADALYSAFDSAGQRCSALRVLCIQEDAAPRLLPMLKGAMQELAVMPPDRLACDIGPVISAAAKDKILHHIAKMRAAGYPVTQCAASSIGNFVAPSLIEIPQIAVLKDEVFGPVLHVVTFARAALDRLIGDINAIGYGLTFGLHSRIDATIAHVTNRVHAGNIYVNRNMVGAVVGVQPFGGGGLSGTGPKAGGPLYLYRLVRGGSAVIPEPERLAGPVGERNDYTVGPRGRVLCLAQTSAGRQAQRDAVLASGNLAVFNEDAGFEAVLFEGGPQDVVQIHTRLAALAGPIVAVHALSPAAIAAGAAYNPAWLMAERVVSTNTAAAGGDAKLLTLDQTPG